MKKTVFILIIFSIVLTKVQAQEVIWLSNTPPDFMKKQVKSSGMHRWSAIKQDRNNNQYTNKKKNYKKSDKDSSKTRANNKANRRQYYGGSTKYVQWIRQGSSVTNASYICLNDSTDYTITLMSPVSKKEPIELIKEKTCYLKFEMNEEGYYNAYLIIKKPVGDTLFINIAKAELLNHSCRNGHHKKLEARPVMHYPKITDFEIVRKRHPYEDFHYFSASGAEEKYQALFKGEAVEGAKITVNTQKGWSNTVYSDKDGIVDIQFIQDYFSNWQELNKRKIHYYLLEAEYTVKKDIEYKGSTYHYISYKCTMSDGYRPARTMYASMVWGLIVFLTVTIVSIAGIFIYKERRKKPYKELKFDEK